MKHVFTFLVASLLAGSLHAQTADWGYRIDGRINNNRLTTAPEVTPGAYYIGFESQRDGNDTANNRVVYRGNVIVDSTDFNGTGGSLQQVAFRIGEDGSFQQAYKSITSGGSVRFMNVNPSLDRVYIAGNGTNGIRFDGNTLPSGAVNSGGYAFAWQQDGTPVWGARVYRNADTVQFPVTLQVGDFNVGRLAYTVRETNTGVSRRETAVSLLKTTSLSSDTPVVAEELFFNAPNGNIARFGSQTSILNQTIEADKLGMLGVFDSNLVSVRNVYDADTLVSSDTLNHSAFSNTYDGNYHLGFVSINTVNGSLLPEATYVSLGEDPSKTMSYVLTLRDTSEVIRFEDAGPYDVLVDNYYAVGQTTRSSSGVRLGIAGANTFSALNGSRGIVLFKYERSIRAVNFDNLPPSNAITQYNEIGFAGGSANSLRVTAQDDTALYVMGNCQRELLIGTDAVKDAFATPTSGSKPRIFIAKFSKDSLKAQWVYYIETKADTNIAGGNTGIFPSAIAVRDSGRIMVSGTFQGLLVADTLTLQSSPTITSSFGWNGFVLSIDQTRMAPDTTIGVQETLALRATRLTLYPNPATERVVLNLDRSGAALTDLRVSDLQGRELYRAAAPFRDGDALSVSDWPAGLYLLHGTLDGQPVQRRLVVR